MSAARQLLWIAVGTVVGCASGAVWAWLASGGQDANDSMIGTAFLCGLLATLSTAVIVTRLARGHTRP